ncbi:E3 ubiquitin-protein ligase TRIM39-like isoform X5 [Chanodichthys erythropterus]
MASSSGNRSQQRQHKDLPDKEVQRGCGSISLEQPNMSDLRIVLLGKNITENNRVGNFILGRAAFESEAPADVELNIEKHRGKLKDRDVTVINTPHLLRPNLSITQITQGVKECVNLSAPGPHVIILVLQQNDFSDNDRDRVKYVLNEFSKEAPIHTLVLTDEREINNSCIHQLIKECGDEHLQFDERKSGLHSEILERVEKILKENQVQFLISDLYEEAGEETPEDGDKRRSGGSVTAEEEGDFDHEDDGKIKQRNKEKKEVAVQRKTLFMAPYSVPALNQELQCSICLEVFTDPVTTPCGHNFCRTCLSKCWTNTQTCFCPFCKEEFSKRLDFKINSTLKKLVQHFNKLNQESEVFCDFCDERKQKAVKSCLTCQSSYCDDHLELHLRVPRLKKHTLINAVANLEDYICQKHERPLEMFCRDDQTCVCLFCTEGEHRTHNTVPIEEESREKKTQTDEQQMIQKRMKKIKEIKHSVKLRKTLASSDGFLTSSRTIHISNGMIIGLGVLLVAVLIILPTQYTMYSSLNSILHTKISDVDEKSLKRALNLLKEQLNEKLNQTELKFVQKFAVDVTLDPDTAHPYLILSDDGKQVSTGDTYKNIPRNPKRFYVWFSVLAKQGFSSGRFYYEVQVKGKTDWTFGVIRESINRKGTTWPSPENGYWTVTHWNENQYAACGYPYVFLSLTVKPEKVGVFVDYEEGLVSFYDVDSRSLIYSFTGQTFTEKLYPYFYPGLNEEGKNSKPLIITPVN